MKNTLYLVYPKSAESGTIETLPKTDGMKLVQEDDFLKNHCDVADSGKVCITSEASLESILKCIKDKSKIEGIVAMKDKHLFRDLLKEMFPSINYHLISFQDIETLKISTKKIIKPIKGCFGTAVKTIDKNSNLDKIAQEIKSEVQKNSIVLSESVLSQSEFIVEDYIEGEEYAVDMFYDSNGQAHIVNIYFHPIPKHVEYLHMIYYTSKAIFKKIYARAIAFFNRLNEKLQLKNVALHSEFRLSDKLVPIEINSMRFGGMGLGNMIYHSLKVNPYQFFIEEKSPDWKEIWKHYPESNFAFLIAYNGTQIDKSRQKPNLEKLESEFTKILNKTVFDYQKQLAFGTYTLEEDFENINKLLRIDFNDYYEKIK
ncbi:ATP-grasp domain-containing protein [Tamlana flava]|uniref:ATP-grasp domain-containing protein n=1 Tax=Tamlana flava TaxID=3158572 RepID=UPI00351BBA87